VYSQTILRVDVIFSAGHADISLVAGYLRCVSMLSTILPPPSAVTAVVRWVKKAQIIGYLTLTIALSANPIRTQDR